MREKIKPAKPKGKIGIVWTIIIGFIQIAVILAIFNAANNNHETIVYAILVFIYAEVRISQVHAFIRSGEILDFLKTGMNLNIDMDIKDVLYATIDWLFCIGMIIISFYKLVISLL